MNTAHYECGCVITEDIVTDQVLALRHCPQHQHLFSDEKTPNEMAEEIKNLYRKPEN